MTTRKTGTVTGANLEKATKGKKGSLTGSRRVTGESSTPASTPTNTPQPTETPITSLGTPTPPSVGEKLKEIANGAASAIEKGASTVNAVQGYVSRVGESINPSCGLSNSECFMTFDSGDRSLQSWGCAMHNPNFNKR